MPRSACSPRKRAKPSGSNGRAGAQLHRRHHLVTAAGVGHGVDRRGGDVGVAFEDPLHGGGGEVLRVHPQPVAAAAREVEVARLVAVSEVAGPVPAVADALGVSRRGSCSSPRSRAHRCGSRSLRWRRRRSRAAPNSSKRARSHSRPLSGSMTTTSSPGGGSPSDPGGVVGGDVDRRPALARAVPLDQPAPKRRSKIGPVGRQRPRCRIPAAGDCRRRRRRSGVPST